ncbi:hypothetical protein V6N11_081894 [Hibiscus sabdariffa]|uniref:Uncharacterized protein n=1 Tax=Hibiscus sabdariffa TaxID=183260 RepID=A0ABR2Q7H8_9ROSI
MLSIALTSTSNKPYELGLNLHSKQNASPNHSQAKKNAKFSSESSSDFSPDSVQSTAPTNWTRLNCNGEDEVEKPICMGKKQLGKVTRERGSNVSNANLLEAHGLEGLSPSHEVGNHLAGRVIEDLNYMGFSNNDLMLSSYYEDLE